MYLLWMSNPRRLNMINAIIPDEFNNCIRLHMFDFDILKIRTHIPQADFETGTRRLTADNVYVCFVATNHNAPAAKQLVAEKQNR